MYKLQNERKVEVNELSDKLRTLKVENNVMKEEVKEHKAKVGFDLYKKNRTNLY